MLPPQYIIDFINIYGSITSLIVSVFLGVLSILLSVKFFLSAKASEIETAKILEAIKNNVTTLNTINNDLLSKALQHLASSNSQMIDIIGQYNRKMESASKADPETDTPTDYESIKVRENEKTESVDNKTTEDSVNKENTEKDNLRMAILNSINTLSSKPSGSASVKIFDLLRRYDFQDVLFEMLRMEKENLISWDTAPNPPGALTIIKIKT